VRPAKNWAERRVQGSVGGKSQTWGVEDKTAREGDVVGGKWGWREGDRARGEDGVGGGGGGETEHSQGGERGGRGGVGQYSELGRVGEEAC